MRRFILGIMACTLAFSFQGLGADEPKEEAK